MAKKTDLDKEVDELFSKLEDYKEVVNKLNDEINVKLKTNMSFKVNGAYTNLNTVGDINTLIILLGLLITDKENFEKASELLGEVAVYKHNNYTYDEWLHDFIIRGKNIKQRDLKSKINEIESILNETLSDEQIRLLKIKRSKDLLKKLG